MKKHPGRVEAAAWRVIDNEAVIVSPVDSEVTILNGAGSLIWKLIDGSLEIGQITKSFCKEYNVSEKEAKGDIEEFIKDLANKKLVK